MNVTWVQSWQLPSGATIGPGDFSRFMIRVDGGNPSNTGLTYQNPGVYSYNVDSLLAPLQDGVHLIEVRLVLTNGNKSTWAGINVTLDRSQPPAPSQMGVQ